MSQAQTRIEETPEEGLVEQGLDLAPNLQLPIVIIPMVLQFDNTIVLQVVKVL